LVKNTKAVTSFEKNIRKADDKILSEQGRKPSVEARRVIKIFADPTRVPAPLEAARSPNEHKPAMHKLSLAYSK